MRSVETDAYELNMSTEYPKYEDLPETYRRDLEERFRYDPEGFEEAVNQTLGDIEYGCDVPVRNLEMDAYCFINGKVAHAMFFHSVHQTDDAYYEQWADVMDNNRIYNCDIELSDKWNWCVENLKGNWSVSSEHRHQSSYIYTIAIADDEDALKFKLEWLSKA